MWIIIKLSLLNKEVGVVLQYTVELISSVFECCFQKFLAFDTNQALPIFEGLMRKVVTSKESF